MEYHKKNELDTSSILLDSSLILTTILSQKATKTYNIKLVDCHDYTQIYIFENNIIDSFTQEVIYDSVYELYIPNNPDFLLNS